jgi:uncharacterized protein DUF4350
LPIPLSQGDRKLLLIAGGVFLLMIAAALFLAKPEAARSETPTTYSTGSGGAKAAYLLLKSSGYAVERWEEPATELPETGGLTLILAEPFGAPTEGERQKLRRFLENGGRIIAIGTFAGLFLPEGGAVPDPLAGMTWKQLSAQSPSSITRAAPAITMSPRAYWRPSEFALPLYGDGKHSMVVMYPYGKGEVMWWAAATPLTNAGLKEPGNLEFFLASLDQKPGVRILWDEYFHGYRRSLAASIENSPVKWMFVQLALFAFILLVTYSRRSGPILIPAEGVRLSPLEFVRTLGLLYEKASASSVAVDICYHRFRYWLTRRLGLPADAPVLELERAIRERWSVNDPQLRATLQACESAPYDTAMKPVEALKLVQNIYDYAMRFRLFPASNIPASSIPTSSVQTSSKEKP